MEKEEKKFNIRTCFSDYEYLGKLKIKEFDDELFQPIEGFIPGAVPPLGELFKRLQLGEPVPSLQEGVYMDGQISDDVMMDNFDVSDLSDDFGRQLEASFRERARVEKDKTSFVERARVVKDTQPPVPEPPAEVKQEPQQ